MVSLSDAVDEIVTLIEENFGSFLLDCAGPINLIFFVTPSEGDSSMRRTVMSNVTSLALESVFPTW